MKRAIYVDYENVSLGGLKDIESLTSDDLVKIFIGSQSSKLSMVEADRIFNCEASVELITNKFIGKNALDFIIMVHMGHDIAQSLAKEYYIISKDKGYDPAIHEMRRLSGLSVKRCDDISATMNKKSVGDKIKGFFKSVKSTETPDTTEHLMVGKKHNSSLHIGKKNDKIEGNSKDQAKADVTEKKQEAAKKQEAPKKAQMPKKQSEAKPVAKPVTKAEVKQEVKANDKPEAKAETKPEPKTDAVAKEAKPEENKPSSSRNRHRRNHKKHNTTNVEQTTQKATETPNKPETKIGETKPSEAKPSETKAAEEVKATKDVSVAKDYSDNKENTAPKKNNRNHHRPPKSKEDEERERQRAEAFALLRELHEEDN